MLLNGGVLLTDGEQNAGVAGAAQLCEQWISQERDGLRQEPWA